MQNIRDFFSPSRIIIISFLFVIFSGTFLLSLPFAQSKIIPVIDVLFVVTSGVCVAGLSTIPLADFSTAGQIILMCLIQIGGIGLMTLSFFFISVFLNVGMGTQLLASKVMDFGSWHDVRKYLIIIATSTFVTELIGAVLLYFPLRERYSPSKAAFYAIFHSVSAFCNCGLDLFGDSLISFQLNPFVLIVMAIVIFIGGTGFFVWFELATKIKAIVKYLLRTGERVRISVHTKITLISTLSLTFIGGIFTWILERNHILGHLSTYNCLVVSFTHSASIRSAGFTFFNLHYASYALLLLFIILIYIGAGSGSTGGGIKVTTWALFMAIVAAIASNRKEVEFFGRQITHNQVYTAIAIVVLSSSWIIFATFLMLVSEIEFTFLQLLFEVVSAFGTCGLSTGITSHLSFFGKIIIISTMYVGRVGSLTLFLALSAKHKKHLYKYPEERIAIG